VSGFPRPSSSMCLSSSCRRLRGAAPNLRRILKAHADYLGAAVVAVIAGDLPSDGRSGQPARSYSCAAPCVLRFVGSRCSSRVQPEYGPGATTLRWDVQDPAGYRVGMASFEDFAALVQGVGGLRLIALASLTIGWDQSTIEPGSNQHPRHRPRVASRPSSAPRQRTLAQGHLLPPPCPCSRAPPGHLRNLQRRDPP
jgi:hypothetical protein